MGCVTGGHDAAGGDIRRLHRQRGVEREHERRLIRDLGREGGAGSRDDEEGRRRQVDGGDEMAPKARTSRGHRVDQVQIGVSDHVGAASALPDEVQRGEQQRHQEECEPLGRKEREIGRERDHRAAPVVGWDATCRPSARARRRRSRQAASGPVHSWSVRSRRWVAPARRIADDLAARRRSATSARRPRKRSSLVSIVRWRPVSGSSTTSRPTSGSRSSRGSRTSTAMISLRRPSRASAGLQVSVAAMKSEITIASPPRRKTRRRPSMARPRSTCPPSGDRATLPTRPIRCLRPPRIGTITWPAGRHDDRADPVAAEDCEPRHGRCDVDRQIGLPPSDGPEVEAAGSVDQDCDVEVALLDRVPDVRFARPGKDRPVHPADVVARLVGSCLSGLDTVAEHERGVTAVSAADHLVAHRQLDTAEPCRQVETGTRCGGHLAAGGSPGRTIGGVCAGAPLGVLTAVTRSLHRLRSLGMRRRCDVAAASA